MSNRRPMSGQEMVQLIWGVALLLMGAAFFFRIPSIMEQLSGIDHFASIRVFLQIGFYLMAIILTGGGVKKLYRCWQINQKPD